MNFNLPAGATARLEMTAGNLVSPEELAEELTKYQYVRDEKDATCWNFQSEAEADQGAYLRLIKDGEAMEIHSWSPENMMNVNYIAMRIGWTECRLIALNHQAYQMISMRLYSVTATEEHLIEGSLESATAPLPETTQASVTKPAPMNAEVQASNIDGLVEQSPGVVGDLEALETLTLRANQAEEQVAELESENEMLRAKVAYLNSQQMSSPPASTENISADVQLLAFIEKHLIEKVDLKVINDSPLGKDLRNLGFKLQCKLVPAQ